ncbi:hypothetical protein V8E53_010011 [Lactarius tabidus]
MSFRGEMIGAPICVVIVLFRPELYLLFWCRGRGFFYFFSLLSAVADVNFWIVECLSGSDLNSFSAFLFPLQQALQCLRSDDPAYLAAPHLPSKDKHHPS